MAKNGINWEVRSAQKWEDGSVSFSIDFLLAEDRPLTVYNCRIVDSKDGNFISFPSRKGKDGKYYSHAYIRLTEEEQEEIIVEVIKTLAATRKRGRK